MPSQLRVKKIFNDRRSFWRQGSRGEHFKRCWETAKGTQFFYKQNYILVWRCWCLWEWQLPMAQIITALMIMVVIEYYQETPPQGCQTKWWWWWNGNIDDDDGDCDEYQWPRHRLEFHIGCPRLTALVLCTTCHFYVTKIWNTISIVVIIIGLIIPLIINISTLSSSTAWSPGCHVVGIVIARTDHASKAKVAKFDNPVFRYQDVFWLHVPGHEDKDEDNDQFWCGWS